MALTTPRRRFLQSLAAPLLPVLPPQVVPPPPPMAPPPVGETRPSPAAEALAEVVRVRYGSQLEPADLDEVKKGIESNLQAAGRVKNAMKLGNADEPVTVFEAQPSGSRPATGRAAPRARRRRPRP